MKVCNFGIIAYLFVASFHIKTSENKSGRLRPHITECPLLHSEKKGVLRLIEVFSYIGPSFAPFFTAKVDGVQHPVL